MIGRNINVPPASATDHNDSDSDGKHPFMFEMVGNFDKGHDKLEGKQLATAVEITRYFYQKGASIKFHREMADKSCPGTGVDKTWFVNLVKNVPVTPPPPFYDCVIDGATKATFSARNVDEIAAKVKDLLLKKPNKIELTKRT
ncbi:peptidoglycan recognition protein family protein [Shimazuella kribbensis]|uniref:peptidoglycan recognition protein family protein n=1 Tax=Shimazuella kribbensis TaxID=139808 RepID=UPI00068592C1|nr:N-acetylmuramoyl-L-alanine amidase [Shimazuella kribbensis]